MTLKELAAHAAAEFQKHYGRPPRWIAAAPGRVNVIGEHTDYNDGFVLPMAIERYAVMAADRLVRVLILRFTTSISRRPRRLTFPRPSPRAQPKWSNYIRGVLAGFQNRGVKIPALDVAFMSTVPLGGGLSSSAALEVCTATLHRSRHRQKNRPGGKGVARAEGRTRIRRHAVRHHGPVHFRHWAAKAICSCSTAARAKRNWCR